MASKIVILKENGVVELNGIIKLDGCFFLQKFLYFYLCKINNIFIGKGYNRP